LVDRPEDPDFISTKQIRPRKLLWHGSRLCNFVGILNQGLRIAPPEAPTSGYMFGKGLYFADRIQKSAEFCYPSPDNLTGLLVLADVVLGQPYILKKHEFGLVLNKRYILDPLKRYLFRSIVQPLQ